MAETPTPDELEDAPPIVQIAHAKPKTSHPLDDATPINEGAYRADARRLGEFEPVPLDELATLPDRDRRDSERYGRLGAPIEKLMEHGEGGDHKLGGGSRSGRKARKKSNKPTEQQAAESTLRRDQEAEFARRSSWVAGRVTPEAHDALIAESKRSDVHSLGTVMQILGEAIVSGASFADVVERIRGKQATPKS